MSVKSMTAALFSASESAPGTLPGYRGIKMHGHRTHNNVRNDLRDQRGTRGPTP